MHKQTLSVLVAAVFLLSLTSVASAAVVSCAQGGDGSITLKHDTGKVETKSKGCGTDSGGKYGLLYYSCSGKAAYGSTALTSSSCPVSTTSTKAPAATATTAAAKVLRCDVLTTGAKITYSSGSPKTFTNYCGNDPYTGKYGKLQYYCKGDEALVQFLVNEKECPSTAAKPTASQPTVAAKPVTATACKLVYSGSAMTSKVEVTYSNGTKTPYANGCVDGGLKYHSCSGKDYTVSVIPSKDCSTSKTTTGSSDCRGCILAGKGFNTEKGKCERGDAFKSFESSASAAGNNWVGAGLDTEQRRQQLAKASAKYAGTFSCEAPPSSSSKVLPDTLPSSSTSATIPGTDTKSPVTQTNADGTKTTAINLVEGRAPSTTTSSDACAAITTCMKCAVYENSPHIRGSVNSCGWDATAGACKRGTRSASNDGKASVGGGNWVTFTTNRLKFTDYEKSCEDVGLSNGYVSEVEDRSPQVEVSTGRTVAPSSDYVIYASAVDNVGLKSVSIIINNAQAGECTFNGERTGDCKHKMEKIFGTFNYYATATDTKGQTSKSDTQTVTTSSVVPVSSDGAAGGVAGSVHIFEQDVCSDCLKLGLGYSSDSQKCERGDATKSAVSSASAAGNNWFFSGGLSCSKIGVGIETKTTKNVVTPDSSKTESSQQQAGELGYGYAGYPPGREVRAGMISQEDIVISTWGTSAQYKVSHDLTIGSKPWNEAGVARIQNAKTSNNPSFGDKTYLEAMPGSISYYLVFENDVRAGNRPSEASPNNQVMLPFMGRMIFISGGDTDSITVDMGERFYLAVGQIAATSDGKKVSLVGVESGDRATIKIGDITSEVVEDKVANIAGTEVVVRGITDEKEGYFDSALVVIGTSATDNEAVATFDDGEAYFVPCGQKYKTPGCSKENPDWVWDLADLHTSKPRMGVVLDERIDTPEDNPPTFGGPNNVIDVAGAWEIRLDKKSDGSGDVSLSVNHVNDPSVAKGGYWPETRGATGQVSQDTKSESTQASAAAYLDTKTFTIVDCSKQTSCPTCLKSSGLCGWDASNNECKKGTLKSGSDDKKAVPSNGNWVMFDKEKTKNEWVKAKLAPIGSLSCENIPQIAPQSPTPPKSDSTTQATAAKSEAPKKEDCPTKTTCETCVSSVCGWDNNEGKCKAGGTRGSDDKTSAIGGWVVFLKEKTKEDWVKAKLAPSGSLSCEKRPAPATTTNKPTETVPSDDCSKCLMVSGKGYVTTTGKCESGTVAGSKESDASSSKGNWVAFSKESVKTSWVGAKLAPVGSLSCEKRPTTEKVASTPTTTSKTYSDPCNTCIAKSGYGYVVTTGKCESGTVAGSKESSASVANGNWVAFSEEKTKVSWVSARLAPTGSLSCESILGIKK